MLTRREAIIGTISASLKYDEAGFFAEHPTDAERIARLADDFAQVWAVKAAEARAGVETPDHLGDLGIVNVRVYGATGDGVTDDTAAIQAAIAAMSAGDTLYFPRGTYVSTGTIYLNKSMTVIGYGATLTGKPLVVTADDVAVLGLHSLDSDNVGIVSNANRTKLIDCRVTDSDGIGIFIETTASVGADIADCEIRGCVVDRSSLGADLSEGGIKVHGYAAGPYEVIGTKITDCTVRMPASPDSDTCICIEVWGGSPHSIIRGNTTYGGSMGISADKSDYSTIVGNTHYQPKLIGIESAGSKRVAITGNTIDCGNLAASGVSVSNTDPDDCSITGNVIYDAANRGIYAASAENVCVNGNTVVQNNASYGVELIRVDGAAVTGNVLIGKSAGTKAVMLNESSSVTVIGNTMKDWTENGVLVFGDEAITLDHITIQGNVFDNCNVPFATQFTNDAALGSNEYIEVYGVAQ